MPKNTGFYISMFAKFVQKQVIKKMTNMRYIAEIGAVQKNAHLLDLETC